MAAKKTTKKPVAKKTTTKKATPAKAKPAKPVTSKPLGVIATIVELLSKATKTKPLTKDALLAQLVKRIPDRGADAMKRTINCQVPSRLWSDKEIEVQSNDETPKGYWINK